ncbi:DivIVA domain-containing protein [Demequina sp. TTPB684]|uniref:DivIVA domain-containing protein n=1 Tax=unclassified Demequina TaxID=2620311 RepID=UPI001CF516FE|nr:MULTISPECIES: DivIVA domain-containing protein [unclassified Demequina]MCB2412132.1 DivIVA domain-containing protein [Demequina sp. TTPB684]UPU89558.1 DivIVA domain-containing protein [Demequina sp. TMPB413]
MALLTAEDVLNKAFSKTKYREGFDQDEVDDFLDEVANSIAALTAERDELQQRLAQAQAGGAVIPAAAPAPAPDAAAQQSRSETFLQAATDPNPPSATTMLAMAQKLHDEYVQAGEEARDRLIDEGKVKAESIVEQAEKDARSRMEDLEGERADLERRIDDLRRFERDYRGHLRNYLENLLGDLEHNASKASAGPVGAGLAGAGFGAAAQDEPSSESESIATADAEGGSEQAGESVSSNQPEAPVNEDFTGVVDSVPHVSPAPLPPFPEAPSPFGELAQPQGEPSAFGSPEPQGEPNPFGTPEPSAQDPSPFVPVQDFEFPPATGKDDESGENQPDAPRWNF